MHFESLYIALEEFSEVPLCVLHRFLDGDLDCCLVSLFVYVLLFCYPLGMRSSWMHLMWTVLSLQSTHSLYMQLFFCVIRYILHLYVLLLDELLQTFSVSFSKRTV
ncbi:hypothetical protein ILYODFUR_037040 [Ilyodon furcidens]|uniref:Uncharacterized protein n=1 Tax=Ilyodon furcidens TaxID=33524 RepID=A0ABV0VLR5_9TELE